MVQTSLLRLILTQQLLITNYLIISFYVTTGSMCRVSDVKTPSLFVCVAHLLITRNVYLCFVKVFVSLEALKLNRIVEMFCCISCDKCLVIGTSIRTTEEHSISLASFLCIDLVFYLTVESVNQATCYLHQTMMQQL